MAVREKDPLLELADRILTEQYGRHGRQKFLGRVLRRKVSKTFARRKKTVGTSGTVGLPLFFATVRGVPDVVVQELSSVGEYYCVIHGVDGMRYHKAVDVKDVRPAVVLDSWKM